MTDIVPIFVTRVNLAKGSDSVLLSMEAPAGGMTSLPIENREVARVVLSDQTFRQVCELFVRTLHAMDAAQARPAPAPHTEGRVFGAPDPQAVSVDDDPKSGPEPGPREHATTKH